MRQRILIGIAVVCVAVGLVALNAVLGSMIMPNTASGQNVDCYMEIGGAKLICDSGGEIELQTGATLDVQSGATTSFGADLDVDGAVTFNSTLDVDGNFSSGTGLITVTDGINQAITTYENLGSLPTIVANTTITYGNQAGAFTVSDGEIWIVHGVLINVTTNYDCTGDDCTLQVGDGNDANGLLDLVDAELQTADTEITGGAAGWQGQLSGTLGAYIADSNFVYAPSGADETIDVAVGGTSPAAGAATVYVIYTRIQ